MNRTQEPISLQLVTAMVQRAFNLRSSCRFAKSSDSELDGSESANPESDGFEPGRSESDGTESED
jgi:hypothetical protein